MEKVRLDISSELSAGRQFTWNGKSYYVTEIETQFKIICNKLKGALLELTISLR